MCTDPTPSNIPTPIWDEFLKFTSDGNSDLASYLQRVFGYCLTGEVGEHAMFFGWGEGGNGKTLILNTIGGILRDYRKTTGLETLTLSNESRHPTELANLRGARMVTVSETQEGRKWDEVKIKQLTGGDPISARFMRQDFFEYHPQFKLFVTGNHKPALTNVDEAIRRRFNLIPFSARLPLHKRDIRLFYKLQPEWPGILHWMIEGCLQWQTDGGLSPPTAVREATDNYMATEDSFMVWWQDCCVRDVDGFEAVADLYTSWSKWSKDGGDIPSGKKTFSQTLINRADVLKLKYGKKGDTTRGFHGVTLMERPKPRS